MRARQNDINDRDSLKVWHYEMVIGNVGQMFKEYLGVF